MFIYYTRHLCALARVEGVEGVVLPSVGQNINVKRGDKALCTINR